MAELTKADVKEIVDGAVVEINQVIDEKIEGLAVMVKESFDAVDARFDRLEGDVKSTKRLTRANSADIAELKVQAQGV